MRLVINANQLIQCFSRVYDLNLSFTCRLLAVISAKPILLNMIIKRNKTKQQNTNLKNKT